MRTKTCFDNGNGLIVFVPTIFTNIAYCLFRQKVIQYLYFWFALLILYLSLFFPDEHRYIFI